MAPGAMLGGMELSVQDNYKILMEDWEQQKM